MKRKILLSPACRAPQLWGYAGEKDHSVLIVELSKDIADCDFCQAEITIKGNLYRTDDLGIIDSKVSFELTTAMVEESGLITAQIVGYVVDENGNILEIAKSEIYTGNIKKSSSGKLTPADSNPSLLDRILAKVHVLIEKAHTHLNKSILDRFGEDEHGGLIYAGKEISSGGVQSLTAFPETASEGDVILLHRCNEISVDDSYGGVILDLPAIASFGLPDEYKEYDYYERVWEFATINPNGTAFSLRLHSYISLDANGEECVLTNLTLVSDTVADNWYWKGGELSTEIPSASPDPLPIYIPLGNVDGFSSTKKLIKDFREYEDTDETVIFRTAPRHYAYMGGNWQLVKGSDVADGAIIGTVKPIEKDGKKFLQLGLLDSHDLRLNDNIPKNIYIPVDDIKSITENIGGVIVNSAEIMLPTGSDNEILDTIVNNNGAIEIDGITLLSKNDGAVITKREFVDSEGITYYKLTFGSLNGAIPQYVMIPCLSSNLLTGGDASGFRLNMNLHEHKDLAVLNKLTEDENGKLLFDGKEIGGDTEEIWQAINDIQGGITEIETLIDESGVLE